MRKSIVEFWQRFLTVLTQTSWAFPMTGRCSMAARFILPSSVRTAMRCDHLIVNPQLSLTPANDQNSLPERVMSDF